jgi:Curli production assembly/transport component CsgG
MRSFLILFVCLAGASFSAAGTDSTQVRLSTAAVLDFQGRGVSWSDAKVLTDRFRVELFQRKAYRMLEREKMNEVLKEQGFQQSGACEQNECAVEVGKLLGVQKMITGMISHIGSTWTVTARVVDVQNGEILQTAVLDRSGDVDGLLQPGMADLAERLRDASTSQATSGTTAKPFNPSTKPQTTGKVGLIPLPDFGAGFQNFGHQETDGSTSFLQVGVIPGLQLVPDTRGINGVALSLPWSQCKWVRGVQAGLVNEATQSMTGIQAGVVNMGGGSVSFLQAGAVNQAGSLTGFQAGVFNWAGEARGLQIGLVNYTRNLKGVQVGFINVALKGAFSPVFPFVNGTF